MEKRLTADMNVVANSNLEIQLLDGDLNVIQKLDDEPNDVGGLTSAELKAKFDESGNIIKKYINETLIPAVLAEDATEAARAAAEAQRETNETQRIENENTRIAAEQSRASAETERDAAEQERVAAEQARADETSGIVAQATAQANAAAQSAESASASAQTAQGAASTATNAASSADQAATSASGSASQAQASAASAAQSAASVDGINKTAQSWAVGGTGTRPGEDTDNAKYWAKRAEGIVSGDVFYVDLEGGYNASTGRFEYTIAMTQDQLTKAYTSGKSLVCRLMLGQIPSTLPLFMAGDQTGMWVFSGSGAIEASADVRFPAETFTVALVTMGARLVVLAQQTLLAIQADLDEHALNNDIHVTEHNKTNWDNKAGKALPFTVTLTAAGWSGNAQTVSNSNFVGRGYAYTVCPASGSYAAYANAGIYADDVTAAGKMTFHCSEKPTANLTVNILRMEATA